MLGLMGFSGSLPLYVIHRYYIFVFIDRANKDACLLALSGARYVEVNEDRPVSLHHHLRIHLLLRKHPLTSPLLSLLLNLKSIKKILYNCPNKQCDSDPIPTWLLKECPELLVPTSTNIVNLSLSSNNFHHTLKESVISPLLKKPTLDKD